MDCCRGNSPGDCVKNMPAQLGRHPWRNAALVLVALLLVAVLAGAWLVRSLLQPQRFTALLQQQLASAGLVLNVDAPASAALWPHPAVQLQGFRLSNAGSSSPLLTASEARIVVPWRALLRREPAIQRFEIQSPHIDLDQLQALLARLPHNAGAPPRLPHIGAGIRIRDGVLLRGDAPILQDIKVETGPLLPNVPFRLDASARDAADRRGALSLRMLPDHQDGTLRFTQLDIGLDLAGGLRAHLDGAANWRGGSVLAANLRGAMSLPANAPASSATAGARASPPSSAIAMTTAPVRSYTLSLEVFPAAGTRPMAVALKLDGADARVSAQVTPSQVLDWSHRLLAVAPGAAIPLPPLGGKAQVAAFEYGPLHAQDLRIEAGPDVAPLQPLQPAVASSAAGNTRERPRGAGH